MVKFSTHNPKIEGSKFITSTGRVPSSPLSLQRYTAYGLTTSQITSSELADFQESILAVLIRIERQLAGNTSDYYR